MSFQDNLTRAVQTRLAELGWYRLQIDGVVGPGTRNAVIDFKRAAGLAARDYIGPITMTRLFAEDAPRAGMALSVGDDPPWLTEARRLLGTRETPGKASNPTIMDWASGLDQWYPGDDVAWCGLFVAHCMAVGAPDEPQDFNRLGAREWLKFGAPCAPSVGAIAVFWRTHPTKSWHGHVGFVVGGDRDTLHILGGNQSDAVTITRISKTRLLGCRGPAGWIGNRDLVPVTGGGVSEDEA